MTDIDKIKSWEDYWKVFDDLCFSLTTKNKTEIVEEFKDAQKYVNGMTDGWFQFLDAFKTVYNVNINELEIGDKENCKTLITALEKTLKRR